MPHSGLRRDEAIDSHFLAPCDPIDKEPGTQALGLSHVPVMTRLLYLMNRCENLLLHVSNGCAEPWFTALKRRTQGKQERPLTHFFLGADFLGAAFLAGAAAFGAAFFAGSDFFTAIAVSSFKDILS